LQQAAALVSRQLPDGVSVLRRRSKISGVISSDGRQPFVRKKKTRFPADASISGLVMERNVRIVYVPGSEVVQLEGLREMSLEVAAAAVGS
jgi:hypothetical protein